MNPNGEEFARRASNATRRALARVNRRLLLLGINPRRSFETALGLGRVRHDRLEYQRQLKVNPEADKFAWC